MQAKNEVDDEVEKYVIESGEFGACSVNDRGQGGMEEFVQCQLIQK